MANGVILNHTKPSFAWAKSRKITILTLLILLAVAFAFVFDIHQLEAFLQQHRTIGVLISLVVYGLLGLTLIPSEPLTLLLLSQIGPVAAITLATLGNTLAAIVEFYIGGSIGDMTDFEQKKDKLPFHLGRLPIDSPAFLLIARMLPGYGPKFVSIAGGIYQVPLSTYLWTALTANLLGAAVVVLSGYGIFELFR